VTVAGRAADAWQRYASHYLAILQRTEIDYRQGGGSVWDALTVLDLEWPNIERAQHWAAREARQDKSVALLCSEFGVVGSRLVYLRADPLKRTAWSRAARRAARRIGNSRVEGQHLGNLAIALIELGRPRHAVLLLERRIAMAKGVGDQEGEAHALGNLAIAYRRLGDLESAAMFCQHQACLSRRNGDELGVARALHSLGTVRQAGGQLDQAAVLYEHAEHIFRSKLDVISAAKVIGNLGAVWLDANRFDDALRLFGDRLRIARSGAIPDLRGEATALLGIARVYAKTGMGAEALLTAERALILFGELRDEAMRLEVATAMEEWRLGTTT